MASFLLRLASGPVFLYHGSAILFGWFSGPGVERFAGSHHWAVLIAYLVGVTQVVGGIAITSGVFCRLGAASVSVIMIGAILIVHLRNGFDVSNGGAEYALAQLLIAGALLLLGPGRYSLMPLVPEAVRKL